MRGGCTEPGPLVNPQFALVPPAAFAGYERRHQQRVSRVDAVRALAATAGTGAAVWLALAG